MTKKILLSAAMFAVVGTVEAGAQAVYFGQPCYPVSRPAVSVGWSGGPWQIAASWGGGGWNGAYAAPYCAPYVRPFAVPVWSAGYSCYPAPVVGYYGTSRRSSSTFVVPRRYGAAPIVADPVFPARASVYPVRIAR